MDIVLTLHSVIRWIILAVLVLAIVKFTIGWAGDSVFSALDRGLASGFSGLMDLQVALGLIYFVWNGIAVAGFPLVRIVHMIIMICAAGAAHVPARLKTLTDKLRFQYSVLAILASLVLVVIGVSILPDGWPH